MFKFLKFLLHGIVVSYRKCADIIETASHIFNVYATAELAREAVYMVDSRNNASDEIVSKSGFFKRMKSWFSHWFHKRSDGESLSSSKSAHLRAARRGWKLVYVTRLKG